MWREFSGGMCLDCLGINKSRLQMFRVYVYLPPHSHHLWQETAVAMVTDRRLSRVDAASSRLAGVGLVGLQVLEEGSVSSSPALAAVPRKVAGAALPTAPLSHEEERLACLHLCTPAGTDASPTHHVEGVLLSNTRVHF